jgi:hypothetical protein
MAPRTRVGQTIGSSLQNLPAPLAALAAQFSTLPASWSLGIAAAAGLYATFRELATDRGRELLEFIDAHKDEFVDTIVNSPEFVAVFVNVWNEHIRETSETKRARLRNFLLSLGSGHHIPQDVHTKIYSIIEQMTDQEAVVFGAIFQGSDRQQFRHMNLDVTTIGALHTYPPEKLKDAAHSLHAYRLIDILDAQIEPNMAVRQITPFGELFYDYVLNEPATNGA